MNKQITFYHVFTDNEDHYFDTLKEAEKQYKKMKDEGCASLRLYEIVEERDEKGFPTGEPEEENCLKSFGYYPM